MEATACFCPRYSAGGVLIGPGRSKNSQKGGGVGRLGRQVKETQGHGRLGAKFDPVALSGQQDNPSFVVSQQQPSPIVNQVAVPTSMALIRRDTEVTMGFRLKKDCQAHCRVDEIGETITNMPAHRRSIKLSGRVEFVVCSA
jgi:hypothetical protein